MAATGSSTPLRPSAGSGEHAARTRNAMGVKRLMQSERTRWIEVPAGASAARAGEQIAEGRLGGEPGLRRKANKGTLATRLNVVFPPRGE